MDLLKKWKVIYREILDLSQTVSHLPEECPCEDADAHLEHRCACCKNREGSAEVGEHVEVVEAAGVDCSHQK